MVSRDRGDIRVERCSVHALILKEVKLFGDMAEEPKIGCTDASENSTGKISSH